MLIQKQMECPYFGVFYAALAAEAQGHDIRGAVVTYAKQHPEEMVKRKVDAVVRASDRYELVDSVLMKRVYDVNDHEIQLRIVAPAGDIGAVDVPAEGAAPLGVRERLLAEYHNGRLGGHMGVEKTAQRILKDWYWPNCYDEVDRWCRHCDMCRGEKGTECHFSLDADGGV